MSRDNKELDARKFTREQYEDMNYWGGYEGMSHEQQKVVKTRKPHQCMTVGDCKNNEQIPVGSLAICETAIDADLGRVSCYLCLECADDYLEGR